MKKRKLKPFVKNSIIAGSAFVFIVLSAVLIKNNLNMEPTSSDFTYVNDYIFDNYYPVINQEEKLIRPYTSDNVLLYKNYYENDATEEEQQNSIIYYDNVYMQNSGVDYQSDSAFDVISAISGTVTNVSEDELLGKSIEIRTSTELITMYQSLSEVSVKKGDSISQGQIIGKSGACALNGDVKNGLHFEMYKSGTVLNPEKYYNKSLKEITNN